MDGMTHALEIPERMYNWLAGESTRRGCTIIEFLEWKLDEDLKDFERDALFNRIHELREKLFAERGLSSDCVPMIREDRDR